MNKKFTAIINDLVVGICDWRIWLLLGWQDIRLRYRRSQLGPFWLSISMAVTIYSMGFLYGHLFKMDLQYYFPFLASGLLTWTLIATVINESTSALIEASGYLKQAKLPYIIFVLRIVTRNIIAFFHNIVPIIPLIFFCHLPLGWHTLLIFVGLLIIALNGIVYGLILSMFGARFRDIGQIITSIIQVIFFLTPIMWAPKFLPDKYKFIVNFNPFTQYVELIRAPIMGAIPGAYAYTVSLSLLLAGFVLMLAIFYRGRHRIIYWL